MSQESDNSTNNQRKDALNNMNNEFIETLNDLMLKKKKFQKKINREKNKLTDLLQNLNTLTTEKNERVRLLVGWDVKFNTQSQT